MIIEGTRSCGKSFTCDIIKENFPIVLYKDLGIRYLNETKSKVNVDDYSIGRDFAYAQVMSYVENKDKIVIDRQYLSTCVYGIHYRNKYDREFWLSHIKSIEDLYKSKKVNVKFLFINLMEEDFDRIVSINRKKDWLDTNDIEDYKSQYFLYKDFLKYVTFPIIEMKAFQNKEYIKEKFLEALVD